jgi:hypothetical protein
MAEATDNLRVALRDHLDSRVDALDRVIHVRLDAADRAVHEAAAKLDVRLDHANDLASTTVGWMRETRDQMVLRVEHEALHEKVDRLDRDMASTKGHRAGREVFVAVVLIFASAIVSSTVTFVIAQTMAT